MSFLSDLQVIEAAIRRVIASDDFVAAAGLLDTYIQAIAKAPLTPDLDQAGLHRRTCNFLKAVRVMAQVARAHTASELDRLHSVAAFLDHRDVATTPIIEA